MSDTPVEYRLPSRKIRLLLESSPEETHAVPGWYLKGDDNIRDYIDVYVEDLKTIYPQYAKEIRGYEVLYEENRSGRR